MLLNNYDPAATDRAGSACVCGDARRGRGGRDRGGAVKAWDKTVLEDVRVSGAFTGMLLHASASGHTKQI